MNKNFWKRFAPDKVFCFTEKEGFDCASTCVDFYRDDDTMEDVELRKKSFKKDFADNCTVFTIPQIWNSRILNPNLSQ